MIYANKHLYTKKKDDKQEHKLKKIILNRQS
jgi:hypothetical protein